jgi:hypothetical protein
MFEAFLSLKVLNVFLQITKGIAIDRCIVDFKGVYFSQF